MVAFMISLIISYRNFAKANKDELMDEINECHFNCEEDSPKKRCSNNERETLAPTRYSYLHDSAINPDQANMDFGSPNMASIKRAGIKNNFIEEPIVLSR